MRFFVDDRRYGIAEKLISRSVRDAGNIDDRPHFTIPSRQIRQRCFRPTPAVSAKTRLFQKNACAAPFAVCERFIFALSDEPP